MAEKPTRYQAYCVDHWGYEVSEEEKARLVLPLRFKPAVTLLLVVVGALAHWPWLLIAVGALGLVGVAVPKLSLLDNLWNHAVRHLVGGPALGADPGPRRLACGIAELFVIGSGVGFLTGQTVLAWIFAAAVLVVAGIVVATGFCVAAWAYLVVARWLVERRAVATIVMALGLLAVPGSARAQTTGYLMPCSAASALGRGCTLLAAGGDPAGMLAHPAGLRRVASRSVSLNGAAFVPTLRYSNAVNPGTGGAARVFPLPSLYVVDRARGRLTLGFGAEPLGGMGADYNLNHPLFRDPGTGAFQPQRYYSNLALLRTGLVAAWEAAPGVSLGATAGLLYGRLAFATPYSINPGQLTGLAGLAADPDYAALLAGFTEATARASIKGLDGFAAALGVSAEFRLSPRAVVAAATSFPATLPLGGGRATMDMNAQFGALYQGMVQAKAGDTATVNAQLAALGVDPALGMVTTYRAQADFGVPRTVTVAVLLQPTDRWSVSVDGGWIGYRTSFSSMPLELRGGTNPNINLLVNADAANGGFRTAWPLRNRDSWVARAGTEYAVHQAFHLRGGVLYGSNPVPATTLVAIFPAIAQWTVSGGASWAVGRTELHLAYAHAFTASAGGTAPHLVAQEYQGSANRLTEDLISAGATWRF